MKNVFITLVGLFFIFESFAQSQKSDLEIIQDYFGKNKKEIVDLYMELDGEKASKFWNVYDEYEMKRQKLVRNRMETLISYVNNYSALTDDQANDIAKQSFKDTKAIDKLHKKYYMKIKKATGALNAVKFMQMELYIQKIIELEILDDIPFIGEMDGQKE